jgi:hypothetical protein
MYISDAVTNASSFIQGLDREFNEGYVTQGISNIVNSIERMQKEIEILKELKLQACNRLKELKSLECHTAVVIEKNTQYKSAKVKYNVYIAKIPKDIKDDKGDTILVTLKNQTFSGKEHHIAKRVANEIVKITGYRLVTLDFSDLRLGYKWINEKREKAIIGD